MQSDDKIPLHLPDALAAEGMNAEAEWVRETSASKAAFFGMTPPPICLCQKRRRCNNHGEGVTASFSNRGHQPKWYYYNNDLRLHGETYWNVSCMTHLGGWVLYDYSLNEGHRDYALIKSTYASYLAGWSLINSGYWNSDPRTLGSSCFAGRI